MELYVGGRNQGKLAYVLEKKGLRQQDAAEGAFASREELLQKKILDHAHLWIRRLLEEGKDAVQCAEAASELMDSKPELIWIADEIGCGIVPLDPKEREYREVTGRILCAAAKRASHMERIICGVGQVLKEKGGAKETI